MKVSEEEFSYVFPAFTKGSDNLAFLQFSLVYFIGLRDMADTLNETLLEKPAAKIIKDLIHTVLHDVANDFIESGGDAKTVLEIVQKRAEKYAEGDIKIKKNPAPRAPRATKAQNEKTTRGGGEVIDAAKNIRNKKWAPHPTNEEYVYYLSEIAHSKGWHWLKEVKSDKVVGAINDEGQRKLTVQDMKAATSLGFKVSQN